MRKLLYAFIFLILNTLQSQEKEAFSFAEFSAYVKTYHPVVKQAQLKLNESEAKLLKARGGVDPKIAIINNQKQFQETEYYDKWGGTFTIPSWYGVSLKAGYNDNEGTYLNPENKLPEEGLYNVGVSVSVLKGLLMNERKMERQKAEIYVQQTEQENRIMVTQTLFEAYITYFDWWKYAQERQLMNEYVGNAKNRFLAVKRSFELGDKPAIDTVEAHLNWKERKLEFEKIVLKERKAQLKVSNYLWQGDIPLELQETIAPTSTIQEEVLSVIDTDLLSQEIIENHPKLQYLNLQKAQLKIEEKWRKNNLLPQLDVHYQWLSEEIFQTQSYSLSNYKAGVQFSMPIFQRKARAELKINRFQQQSMEWQRKNTALKLQNDWIALQTQLKSYETQLSIAQEVVDNALQMVKGENRKFEIGESTIFLVNSRESKWLDKAFKSIDIQKDMFVTYAEVFKLKTIN